MFRKIAREVYRRLPFVIQVPLARGKPEAAFWIRPQPKELIVDYYLGAYRMKVDAANDVERRMLSGSYESDTMAVIARFVRPGDVAIDVGANVGAVTVALAHAVGPNGRVEAFEPGPLYFARLEANLALNPELKERVRTHRIGLARETGALVWQASITVSGTASTYTGQIDTRYPTIEVPAHPLDEFAEKMGIARADFVKIDVDGIELDVLLGAERFLERTRPVIYMEVNMWNEETRESARKIDEFLTRLGYRIFNVHKQGADTEPTRFPDFTFNILAKRE